MTQQRTFPENVRRATSGAARKPSLHPCPDCFRPCLKERCFRCSKPATHQPAYKTDMPLILEWARELRTEQAIAAYARKKANA